MKSSNLAWRIEPFEAPEQSPAPQPAQPAPREPARPGFRMRPAFERRTIEIRDQGFAAFRVR